VQLAGVSTGPDRQSHGHEQDHQESCHLDWKTRPAPKDLAARDENGADAERVSNRATKDNAPERQSKQLLT
jgi:hypothetical protein